MIDHDKLLNDDDGTSSIPVCMWRSALIISFQSFLYGYTFTCLNSCLVTGDNNSSSDCFNKNDTTCPKGSIYNDIDLSAVGAQLATSLTIIGAWIGSLLGSYPAERYGRKLTILGNNIFFIIGGTVAATGDETALYIGRFITGIGVGIGSAVPPVLLAEIAQDESRGTITTVHQVMLTFSIFFAAILGYGMVTYVDHGWQYIQAFATVPSISMLLLQRFVPESPKWMLATLTLPSDTIQGDTSDNTNDNNNALLSGRYEGVLTSLRLVRREGDDFHKKAEKEISLLLEQAQREAAENANAPTWAEVFASRRAVIVGCGLMFFQASTGINSVFFYSSTIFGLAGFSQSIVGSAVASGVNFLTTLVAIRCIDHAGRKTMLCGGTYGMLASLALLSAILLSGSVSASVQGIVAVCAVVAFVISYAFGLGAVCWAVMSELVPTRVRSKAMSLFLSVNWATNLLVAFLTLTAIDGLGQVRSDMNDDQTAAAEKKGVAYLYLVFEGFTILAIFFFQCYVPETKGMTPEDFQKKPTAYTQLLPERDHGDRSNLIGP